MGEKIPRPLDKAVSEINSKIGNIASLTTSDKTSLVSAVNEVNNIWKTQIRTGTLNANGELTLSFSQLPVCCGFVLAQFALSDNSCGTDISICGYWFGKIAQQSLNLGEGANFSISGNSDAPIISFSFPAKANKTVNAMITYRNLNPRNL